jgi:hypothetical protein
MYPSVRFTLYPVVIKIVCEKIVIDFVESFRKVQN